MRKTISTFVLALALITGAAAVHAQEQAPFSEAELLRCTADTPQLIAYVESLGGEAASLEDEGAAQQFLGYPDAQAWLADRGWQPERFAYVLDHVSRGYAATKVGQERPAVDAQMQQAMSTPGLSPEMLAQMSEAMAQLDAAQNPEGVLPSEMALIQAHLDEVEKIFNGE